MSQIHPLLLSVCSPQSKSQIQTKNIIIQKSKDKNNKNNSIAHQQVCTNPQQGHNNHYQINYQQKGIQNNNTTIKNNNIRQNDKEDTKNHTNRQNHNLRLKKNTLGRNLSSNVYAKLKSNHISSSFCQSKQTPASSLVTPTNCLKLEWNNKTDTLIKTITHSKGNNQTKVNLKLKDTVKLQHQNQKDPKNTKIIKKCKLTKNKSINDSKINFHTFFTKQQPPLAIKKESMSPQLRLKIQNQMNLQLNNRKIQEQYLQQQQQLQYQQQCQVKYQSIISQRDSQLVHSNNAQLATNACNTLNEPSKHAYSQTNQTLLSHRPQTNLQSPQHCEDESIGHLSNNNSSSTNQHLDLVEPDSSVLWDTTNKGALTNQLFLNLTNLQQQACYQRNDSSSSNNGVYSHPFESAQHHPFESVQHHPQHSSSSLFHPCQQLFPVYRQQKDQLSSYLSNRHHIYDDVATTLQSTSRSQIREGKLKKNNINGNRVTKKINRKTPIISNYLYRSNQLHPTYNDDIYYNEESEDDPMPNRQPINNQLRQNINYLYYGELIQHQGELVRIRGQNQIDQVKQQPHDIGYQQFRQEREIQSNNNPSLINKSKTNNYSFQPNLNNKQNSIDVTKSQFYSNQLTKTPKQQQLRINSQNKYDRTKQTPKSNLKSNSKNKSPPPTKSPYNNPQQESQQKPLQNQSEQPRDEQGLQSQQSHNSNIYRPCRYRILTLEQKMHLVNQLKDRSIADVARVYNVSINNLSRWKKSCMRRSGAGRRISDLDMESKLIDWIKFQLRRREMGAANQTQFNIKNSQNNYLIDPTLKIEEQATQRKFNPIDTHICTTAKGTVLLRLTRRDVQQAARRLSSIKGFKASKGWFERFAKRHKHLIVQRNQDGVLGLYSAEENAAMEKNHQACREKQKLSRMDQECSSENQSNLLSKSERGSYLQHSVQNMRPSGYEIYVEPDDYLEDFLDMGSSRKSMENSPQ